MRKTLFAIMIAGSFLALSLASGNAEATHGHDRGGPERPISSSTRDSGADSIFALIAGVAIGFVLRGGSSGSSSSSSESESPSDRKWGPL